VALSDATDTGEVSDSDSDFGSEFESNYELELSDNSDFDLS
jgi:hypothetical protein